MVINTGVDAQVRDELKSIKETVQKNHETIQPTLEEWKRLKTLGYGISGAIALAGLTAGATITWASDGAVAWIRHWLKIN
ncbi:transmembrane protein [Rhizobium leguminosarum bv. phaseoli CCGM1]|nr:transmembrane protein [Rhizobium leguminosarum bv. phaseoli CCGM1]